MTDDDASPLHRLAREYETMRGGIAGDIELAAAGDTELTRGLLTTFILQARSALERCPASEHQGESYIDPHLLEYVAGLLDSALKVETTDVPKALGLAPGKSGRPRRTASQNEDHVCIGMDVYFTWKNSENLDDACEVVAERWNVSSRQALRAYRSIDFAFRKMGTSNF